ncbi:hypothetical protein P152DRAFT_331660 [Eremomyces bilateralis CBS 781.70]|uniref:Uncharacterized protein n=1 Tax=Eremomyces bilateralis CBS 781.70 TaxID=1392243 RepID=A0A6G1G544_9PEZI|nr:uncharacterized protein P152DRAFT_331660 [Eremomyces bilateralis CBS 781.70]KAF1812949.1 hypothetical protein P152DRAFT_331660 [Eremomyces bilateralis CBS 781.70]
MHQVASSTGNPRPLIATRKPKNNTQSKTLQRLESITNFSNSLRPLANRALHKKRPSKSGENRKASDSSDDSQLTPTTSVHGEQLARSHTGTDQRLKRGFLPRRITTGNLVLKKETNESNKGLPSSTSTTFLPRSRIPSPVNKENLRSRRRDESFSHFTTSQTPRSITQPNLHAPVLNAPLQGINKSQGKENFRSSRSQATILATTTVNIESVPREPITSSIPNELATGRHEIRRKELPQSALQSIAEASESRADVRNESSNVSNMGIGSTPARRSVASRIPTPSPAIPVEWGEPLRLPQTKSFCETIQHRQLMRPLNPSLPSPSLRQQSVPDLLPRTPATAVNLRSASSKFTEIAEVRKRLGIEHSPTRTSIQSSSGRKPGDVSHDHEGPRRQPPLRSMSCFHTPPPHSNMKEVEEPQPRSYWAGRFAAQSDIILNETLEYCPGRPEDLGDHHIFSPSDRCRRNTKPPEELHAQRIFDKLQSQCRTQEALGSLKVSHLSSGSQGAPKAHVEPEN